MSAWEDELRQAEADFANLVIPAMRRLPHGNYVSVQTEGLTSPSAGILDRHAGIDWLVSDGSGVTSVASRVEYVGTPYTSFTIGRNEMSKRLRFADGADAASSLGPTHTVQAYVRERGEGPFLAAVSVLTADLYSFVRDYPGCVMWKRNRRDGKEFGVVWIECMWDEDVTAAFMVSQNCRAFRSREGVIRVRDCERFVCDECAAERGEAAE